MKFSVTIFKTLLFVILITPILLFAVTEPAEPSVETPTVSEPSDPEFSSSSSSVSSDSATNQEMTNKVQKLPVILDGPGLTNVSGELLIPKESRLTVSNWVSNKTEIFVFSTADIAKIRILRWKIKNIKSNLYRFTPDLFVFTLLSTETNQPQVVQYKGRLKDWEILKLEQDGKITKFFTMFFDRWVKGEKDLFHWQNSQADLFSYPLNHPIENVVNVIRLHP